jgi:hypothetical protein
VTPHDAPWAVTAFDACAWWGGALFAVAYAASFLCIAIALRQLNVDVCTRCSSPTVNRAVGIPPSSTARLSASVASG